MVIAYVDLPLGIVDTADVAATFMRAAAATFISPTVASTGLNSRKLSEKLLLGHIGYGGYEVISCLRIFNTIKVIPNFKSLDCVLDSRVLEPPE